MEILRHLVSRLGMARPAMTGGRLAMFLGLSVLVLVTDQLTKAGIRAWLEPGETWPRGWEVIRLSHVHNSGAAFGIFQGQTAYLAFASVFMMLALVIFLATLPSHTRWYPLALSGILGGAIGNFIDRVRLGYVTDFIDPMRYPSFNVADSAIVVGVALVLILTLFGEEEATEAASEADLTAGRGDHPGDHPVDHAGDHAGDRAGDRRSEARP